MQFVLSTAVWGKPHVEAFLRHCVPTLLASGNIPELRTKQSGRYVISTSTADRARMEGSKELARLADLLPVEFFTYPEWDFEGNPHIIHHQLWLDVMTDAAHRGEWVAFITPDCLFANGSIAHMGRRIAAGKAVLFGFPLRVIEHTFLAALDGVIDRSAEVWDLSRRKLVELALEHLSPMTICYMRETRRFGHWPEYLVYPVAGEGLVFRAFAGHCYAVDPGRIRLDGDVTPHEVTNPTTIEFMTDSDDYANVSLTSFWHQVHWFFQPRKLDLVNTALWCSSFDAPINRLLARQSFLFHSRDMAASKWRPVIARADNNIMLTYLAQQFVWIVRHLMPIEGMRASAELIAWALQRWNLHRCCISREPLTVLIPTEKALADVAPEAVDRILAASRASIAKLFRNHCLLGSLDEALPKGKIETLSGYALNVRKEQGEILVDNRPVRPLVVETPDPGALKLCAFSGLIGGLP
jgi:hypothetical protein